MVGGLNAGDPTQKAKILGLLARMALVAIHSQLDQGYGWKNADQVSDPSSPKFEALAVPVIGATQASRIVDLVLHIERCNNVGELLRLTVPSGKSKNKKTSGRH